MAATHTAADLLIDRLVEDTCDWAAELASGYAGSCTYVLDPADPAADEVSDWVARHGLQVRVELHADGEDAWITYTVVDPEAHTEVEVEVELVHQYHLRNDLQAEAAAKAAKRVLAHLAVAR